MSNVFKDLGESGGVFRSEAALQPDYLPPALPGRESQTKSLALALSPATQGLKPQHVFVYGAPGTGKTSAVRFVLKELEEYSSQPWTAFINCWQAGSRMAVLARLSEQSEAGLPRRGLSADEVMRRVVELLKKEKRAPIVALDEVDQLFAKKEEGILYDLLRAQETWGLQFGLVLVTNYKDVLAKMDRRVRSSFNATEIEFPQYKPTELKRILKERAEVALQPGSYTEEALAICAAHAARNGDARVALETLYRAARLAEQQGKEQVTPELARQASAAINPTTTAGYQAKLQALGTLEKAILNALREAKKPLTSGELYDKVRKTRPGAAERTLREHVTALEKRGVITAKEKEGAGGRTRILTLK